MTTQYQIEISKNFPLSTQAALACANERRQELEADIQKFLENGGKINEIKTTIVGRAPLETLTNFCGETKETSEWLQRRKFLRLVEKNNLRFDVIGNLAGVSKQMMCKYFRGKINPRPEIRTKIENVINSLCNKSEA